MHFPANDGRAHSPQCHLENKTHTQQGDVKTDLQRHESNFHTQQAVACMSQSFICCEPRGNFWLLILKWLEQKATPSSYENNTTHTQQGQSKA